MSTDIWKPLINGKFDTGKYLYHYTNIDKAIQIIHSETLRFASICNTNDTIESKPKIIFDTDKVTYEKKSKKILEYFKRMQPYIRLICFSLDSDISSFSENTTYTDKTYKKQYYDVSGRGFALPRMWAQYASNNEGVCFIINKEKLEKAVEHITLIKSDKVIYKKIYDRYIINEENINLLYKQISNIANGRMVFIDKSINDADFLKYNYFEKLDDWENEREYRMVTMTENTDDIVSVKKLFSFVEGIVIGEKINPAYEYTIKTLIKNKSPNKDKLICSVKKIEFGSDICRVK